MRLLPAVAILVLMLMGTASAVATVSSFWSITSYDFASPWTVNGTEYAGSSEWATVYIPRTADPASFTWGRGTTSRGVFIPTPLPTQSGCQWGSPSPCEYFAIQRATGVVLRHANGDSVPPPPDMLDDFDIYVLGVTSVFAPLDSFDAASLPTQSLAAQTMLRMALRGETHDLIGLQARVTQSVFTSCPRNLLSALADIVQDSSVHYSMVDVISSVLVALLRPCDMHYEDVYEMTTFINDALCSALKPSMQTATHAVVGSGETRAEHGVHNPTWRFRVVPTGGPQQQCLTLLAIETRPIGATSVYYAAPVTLLAAAVNGSLQALQPEWDYQHFQNLRTGDEAYRTSIALSGALAPFAFNRLKHGGTTNGYVALIPLNFSYIIIVCALFVLSMMLAITAGRPARAGPSVLGDRYYHQHQQRQQRQHSVYVDEEENEGQYYIPSGDGGDYEQTVVHTIIAHDAPSAVPDQSEEHPDRETE